MKKNLPHTHFRFEILPLKTRNSKRQCSKLEIEERVKNGTEGEGGL